MLDYTSIKWYVYTGAVAGNLVLGTTFEFLALGEENLYSAY